MACFSPGATNLAIYTYPTIKTHLLYQTSSIIHTQLGYSPEIIKHVKVGAARLTLPKSEYLGLVANQGNPVNIIHYQDSIPTG